jgi:uncharacterized iron-regulated protein
VRSFCAVSIALFCLNAVPAAADEPVPSDACRKSYLAREDTLIQRRWNRGESSGPEWMVVAKTVPEAPLAGRIWSTQFAHDIDDVSLHCAIQSANIVLLGEIHDNAVHHLLRESLIYSKLDQPSAIVFEQLRTDAQPALSAFTELNSQSPDQAKLPEFKRLTGWEKSGWQQYNYDPLLLAAIDSKLPLYAGDAPRDAMMKVAKDGEGVLPAADRTRMKLDVPLSAKLDDASLVEIEEAHCGTMPKEAFTGMAYAQRYRDATLAETLLNAAEKHGSAILIAGNGHVRTDRGVPWYVRQRAPNKTIISVMLIEVEDGKTDPASYVPRDPDGKPVADYIIFTPPADHEDNCAKMLEKMKK